MINDQINLKQEIKQMVEKEGVLANNDILNKEEYSAFVKQHFNEDVINKASSYFSKILGALGGKNVKEAYRLWEEFQGNVLKMGENFATSLLMISEIKNALTFSYESKEYDLLTTKGYFTAAKETFENMLKLKTEDQIQNHLQKFFTDVQEKEATEKTISLFIQQHQDNKSFADNVFNVYKRFKDNPSYKNVLYGNSEVWRGNVADAFINHLAHRHANLLKITLVGHKSQEEISYSVFEEEKNNIDRLLVASTNNIPYYTGGDVIFKYGGQIFSIQVKSTKNLANEFKYQLAVSDFEKLIRQFDADLTSNIEKFINTSYDALKTSGFIEKSVKETVRVGIDKF